MHLPTNDFAAQALRQHEKAKQSLHERLTNQPKPMTAAQLQRAREEATAVTSQRRQETIAPATAPTVAYTRQARQQAAQRSSVDAHLHQPLDDAPSEDRKAEIRKDIRESMKATVESWSGQKSLGDVATLTGLARRDIEEWLSGYAEMTDAALALISQHAYASYSYNADLQLIRLNRFTQVSGVL